MPPRVQAAFASKLQGQGPLGGARVATQQDLSGYFAVRAAELYLEIGGQLAMVMPLSALSRQAFAGFRKGDYGNVRFDFSSPWDLDRVRPAPFPVPSSVVFAKLRLPGRQTRRDAVLNSKVGRQSRTRHGNELARREPCLSVTDEEQLRASMVTCICHSTPSGSARVPPSSPSPLHGRAGPVAGGLGLPSGVARVRSKRSTLEKTPWRELPDREATIEDRFPVQRLPRLNRPAIPDAGARACGAPAYR